MAQRNSLEKELARLEAKMEFLENAPAEEHSTMELKSLLGEFSKEGERLLELSDLEEIKKNPSRVGFPKSKKFLTKRKKE